MAHRLAWLYVTGSWPTHVIDHINGNPADNRFANLRDVTPQVNTHNQRRATKGRKTGSLLGAQWIPAKQKWRAVIKHNSRVTYVGLFGTEQEAHAAYVAAKRVIHKEGCTL
jgi:hypothetical protein